MQETIDTKVIGKTRKVADKEFTTSGREGKQALIVYHLVSERFKRARNFVPQNYLLVDETRVGSSEEVKKRAMNTMQDAERIAELMGCKFGLANARYDEHGNGFLTKGRYNISKKGNCVSAVLTGKNPADLIRARDTIYRHLGYERLVPAGNVSVKGLSSGSEKAEFYLN